MGAPPARLPAIMRLTSRPPLDRLLAALPVNEAVARRMFRQIGLRQALDAGRISALDIATYAALLRHTDTVANELLINRHVTSPRSGLNEGLLLPDALLTRIELPVHFLWGAEDPFGGEDIARKFAARFPNAELELMPGVGHAVWMDDVERAAATARHFLGG